MPSERYEATLRRKKTYGFPKQFFVSKDLEIRPGYSARATIWVPKTPGSHLRPSLVLTLGHNGDRIRICSNGIADLVRFVSDLELFVAEKSIPAHEAHQIALQDWHNAHGNRHTAPNHLNDTTRTTVLQDEYEEGENRGERVNKRTGEITYPSDASIVEGQKE